MVLISNDASYCGLAYVMNDPATFSWPYSVISPNCLPLTLAHELGHNFGMQHDHDQYSAGGAHFERYMTASLLGVWCGVGTRLLLQPEVALPSQQLQLTQRYLMVMVMGTS